MITPHSAQSLRALIVDDDPRWRTIVAEALSELGWSITTVAQPPKSLSGYQLAVLDISLDPTASHNRDGLTLMKQLTAIGTPCIILSGSVNAELVDDSAQQPDVLGVLHKDSFQRAEFMKLIKQTFAQPIQPKGQVLIVEDDSRWRAIYADILAEAGYVLHTAISYGEARGWLQRTELALAIVDLHLISSAAPEDNRDGFWFLRAAHQRGLPTIVVSALGEPTDIDRAYEEFSVFAFVEKEGFDRRAFLATVNEAIRTRPIIETPAASTPTPIESAAPVGPPMVSRLSELTDRELEVLAHLAEGSTNRQISQALNITPNTVKKHVDHILQKLEVNTRAAAVAVALRDEPTLKTSKVPPE
jgi:two-component system nitrate/nitrite response regulator NarL